MSYYQDLSDCNYYGLRTTKVLAIGWLDVGMPFTTGEVAEAFFVALLNLLRDPWEPAVAAGMHRCPFCRFTGGPREVRYGGIAARVGAANLFVPYKDCVFVAPSLIAHYVDAHGYSPPAEFQTAVAECPPMRSLEYLERLRAHDVHKLRAPKG